MTQRSRARPLTGTAPAAGGTGALDVTDAHTDLVAQFTAAGTSLTASRSYGPWGAVTATSQAPQAGSLGYQFQYIQPRHRPDVPTSAFDLFNQLRASGEISVSP